MRDCLLCGIQTEGSVGAAGIKWNSICQQCKDLEDTALLVKISRQKELLDNIWNALSELKKEEVAK